DYFALDELLTDDERMVRDTFRRFVDEEVMPTIGRHFRDGTFPKDLPKKLGALGALGASLEGYGCAGLGANAYGLIMQELERGDSGIRSFASVQSSLVMYPIWAYGSEAQKQRWLPEMAAGKAIGCFGLTEPDFGSNPGGMRTTAKKTADGWVLNGSKQWITNGTLADVAVVWAKTPEGVRGFLVEKGTPGFTSSDQHGKFSLRASTTSELGFHDCHLPADAILPGSTGLKSPLMCLNQARYGIAWGGVGSAMECYHTALEYAKQRVQFNGQPIACHQMVQEKLVWMAMEISKGQLLCLQLGRLKDAGRLKHWHISMGKRNNVWVARESAKLAREILGANGIVDDYPVIRHMLNIESVFTYEGTHDIHALVIGEAITGIPAFNAPERPAARREREEKPAPAETASLGSAR
ncbi:MAG TPA: acyl-CoA dehydrogenase family protein, partial [Thermoanaerobaculia bacterium]|nr:acyl-CoA dehydrogenase family protein [Thermoanaerobaculia bacterium]